MTQKNKPIGPLPPAFQIAQDILSIDGVSVRDLCARYGSPLFVYSAKQIEHKIKALKRDMPDRLAIHYAIKANPQVDLLSSMVNWVDGLDVASGGELELALNAGGAPSQISFAGPGKRDAEIKQAIEHGATINLESPNEAQRALRIADELAMQAQLAVRVNPDFDLKGSGMRMGGGAKPFGMDIELVPSVVAMIEESNAIWRGFHIFAGSQALDSDAIIEAQMQTVELAQKLAEEIGTVPTHVNLGGGFGIPYFPGDKPVDTARIGKSLNAQLESLPSSWEKTQFSIELGRFLVGEAGVYLTEILDKKTSHGEIFLIVDGGMHHQLAASGNFGTVIKRNYPAAIATRFNEESSEVASIVGCLCTPLDRLCDQGLLAHADVGDIVAIFCAGAYGASASPTHFLGHGPAKEVFLR